MSSRSKTKGPSKTVYIGKIYADWCGHCRTLVSEWDSMKRMVKLNMGRTLKNMNIKFDIIFIDGDHTYEGVKLDFFNYASFLKDDGLLIFDDYNKAPTNKGVFKFINDHLINNSNYEHIQFYDNEHKGELIINNSYPGAKVLVSLPKN